MAESRPLIDLIEDMPNIDQFYVSDKDPEFYYCWINAKPDNVERAKAIYGYEVLGAKHSEHALVPPNAAGERKLGDVVLARMPRERWERLERMRVRKTEQQIAAANDAWRDKTERSGFQTEDTTRSQVEVLTLKKEPTK